MFLNKYHHREMKCMICIHPPVPLLPPCHCVFSGDVFCAGCTGYRPNHGVITDLHLTHSFRSRFLPFIAGMILTTAELSLNDSKMCVDDSGTVMLTTEVQPPKAYPSMWITDSPIVMLTKEVQSLKASSPMWATDSPKVMLTREVQLAKAR